MRKFAFVALLAATAAAPAFAQDAPPEPAPFTGLRAEGIVGYDNLSDGGDGDSGSRDGVLYGGQVGYDFQVGRAILGIEGEITGASTDTRADDLISAGDRFSLDAGRDLYAGARVGFAVSPTAMMYAKGGYTNFQLESEYRLGNTTTRDTAELDGFRVGAGVEYQLTPQLHLKGEYRYSNYSNLEGYDIDLDRHQVLGGIGVRF